MPLREFSNTAKGLSRNPLGIIALFIVLIYGLACLVIMGSPLTPLERWPLIYFLVIFPFVVLGVFSFLVAFRAGQLYAPSDYKDDKTFAKIIKRQTSAVASLAVVQQTKNVSRAENINIGIEGILRSVESAAALARTRKSRPKVLWVDDRPDNNIYERKAMESLGIKFFLSETTEEALSFLSRKVFSAVISDMGRREGPREGYTLLDAMRSGGDETPVFFYASSNAPEHKQETYEHGGQGCTNDGQELFDMVTKAVLGPRATGHR